MTAIWPAALPKCFMRGTYQSAFVDTSMRSDVDQAPGKSRKRFSIGVRPISGVMNLKTVQLADLRTFFEATVASGTLPFTFPDPEGGADLLVRFTAAPEWQEFGKRGIYAVSLQMEVLP